jgi:hypothetical protein
MCSFNSESEIKKAMNHAPFTEILGEITLHDLPTGGAGLAGLVLLFLVVRSGKVVTRALFLLLAIVLFAGAYWWHTHR